MTFCILFLLGLAIFWVCFQTADEVYRLALASVGLITVGWSYFSSPSLFQWLSGILVLGVYQIYVASVESSL